jgi:hypothetical protein
VLCALVLFCGLTATGRCAACTPHTGVGRRDATSDSQRTRGVSIGSHLLNSQETEVEGSCEGCVLESVESHASNREMRFRLPGAANKREQNSVTTQPLHTSICTWRGSLGQAGDLHSRLANSSTHMHVHMLASSPVAVPLAMCLHWCEQSKRLCKLVQYDFIIKQLTGTTALPIACGQGIFKGGVV